MIIDEHAEKAKLRILIFCERPSATQEVHLLRPLRRMRRDGECAVVVASEASVAAAGGAWLDAVWSGMSPHLVVLSRFAGPETAAILDHARLAGTPIITHLDDFLLEVPPDLGADKVRRHNRPERVAALVDSLRRADLLYISTKPLAQRLQKAGFDTPIMVADLQSCADPAELEPLAEVSRDTVRIGYQGTRNHHLDLAMIVPAVANVLSARPNATFETFGTIEPPTGLEAFGSRVRHHPPVADYSQFLDRLKALDWAIGVAPLRATEFNGFRTHTKWTEYAMAGVAIIASDSVVYRDVVAGGAGLLAAEDKWEAALLRLVDDAQLRRAMAEAAQDRLRSELTLSAMEAQLLAAFRLAIAPSENVGMLKP